MNSTRSDTAMLFTMSEVISESATDEYYSDALNV